MRIACARGVAAPIEILTYRRGVCNDRGLFEFPEDTTSPIEDDKA